MSRSGRLTRAARDEAGNAIVEFVYLAVLLMVPLTYIMLTLFRVQGAAYAVSSATREAGRVYVSSASSEVARDRALAAASIVMADSDLRLPPQDVHIICSADPCLTPGATVDVAIGYDVALPFLPRLFDAAPARVHVEGRHLEVVDRFRATR